MLSALFLIPAGIICVIAYLYYQSVCDMKIEKKVVAEKKITVTPNLTAGEIEAKYHRLQIARFLSGHYGSNMVNWEPDSWACLKDRNSFVCRVYLSNGNNELCRIWQKDEKPVKIQGVGAKFSNIGIPVTEKEFQEEKEKREFSLENWLNTHTPTILKMCEEAKEQNKTSILVPNNILPLTKEAKMQVQKALMQTSLLGGSQIEATGIYFQLL